MIMLEELKKEWNAQPPNDEMEGFDLVTLKRTVKDRVKEHKKMALRYFWTTLLLQLLVYLLLGYVILTHTFDTVIVAVSVLGLLLYIPFTLSLFKRAREVVAGKVNESSKDSLYGYVRESHRSLCRFFRFKKLSDVILTPLSSVIGVYLTFRLFIPGGVQENFYLAQTALVITLISCLMSILKENRKKFKEPLQKLKELMNEFETFA